MKFIVATVTPSSSQVARPSYRSVVLASQQFDVRTMHQLMYTFVAQRKSVVTFLKPTLNTKGGVYLFLVSV
jgi:hypothetical protein